MSELPQTAPEAVAPGRPVLTPLSGEVPGLRRWLHSLPPLVLPSPIWSLSGRRRSIGDALRYVAAIGRLALRVACALSRLGLRVLQRIVDWMVDQVSSTMIDLIDRFRTQPPPILRMEKGTNPLPGCRSIAVMVQYSPTGAISEMVLRQIAAYRELGFAVVLVSNSPTFPEEAWQGARREAALVVHRRNRGLDFGAWKDLVPEALECWPGAEELLIVNDSVLGPIRPLGPVLDTMRAGGPGFYGMLESTQGGPHLQSWFLLAHGPAVVADAADFLARLRLSHSKWKIIQRGELRFARHMRWKGHRVAAAHGYARLIDIALADAAERPYLDRAIPLWMRAARKGGARRLLLLRPVNPAHHLWRVLSGPAGCPFIKTELVRRNPGGLPDVDTWPDLVPPDSPCPVDVLRAHLASLGP